jgi:alpha-L-fucosidase
MLECPAVAENYVEVTSSSTGTISYLDFDSINRVSVYNRSNVYEAWIKYDYSRDSTVVARYSMNLIYFDCDENSSAIKLFVNYSPSGQVLNSNENPYPTFRRTVPRTVANTELTLVCAIAPY